MKKIYLLMTVLMLGVITAGAQSTLTPSQDMTTNTGASGMFPSADQLWIANWSPMQNYHQLMIQFDLSDYEGQQVTTAVMNINQFFHAPDASPTPSKVYAITEQWGEDTWDNGTAIGHSDTEYAIPEFIADLGWYEFDITTLVNEWLAGTTENNGFVMIADANTKFAEFYSKDASNETVRPFLTLTGLTGVNELDNGMDISIYPNPVYNNAEITFSTSENSDVTAVMYNMTGSAVMELCNKTYSAGTHTLNINAQDFKSGIYFLRICHNNEITTKKIILK